jgi:hypothetical protein
MSLKPITKLILEHLPARATETSAIELISFSEFYYQLSVDGLANGSDAFGG